MYFDKNKQVKYFATLKFALFICVGTMLIVSPTVSADQTGVVQITGEQKLWHKITLTFDGPDASEDGTPNPFLDYRLTVTFTHNSKIYRAPGYYAADGFAAETSATSGNKWRVHFMPDEVGVWNYTASFRTGANVAVDPDLNAGTPTSFDSVSGSFTVMESDKTGKDFRGKGLLEYVGQHHLRFAGTGEYFLKGGADSPENFLGYFEFDGTYDTGGIIPNFLHHYAAHAGDWQAGDPTWQGNKGKNIIGALNYLSSQSINSVYFITYNLNHGDGQDTWPWINDTARDRFDVSKLDQWEIVFSHMTKSGIQLHLLTQETENDSALGGIDSTIRRLYYRELIARFAHHPVLQWNIGEENRNTDAEKLAFAQYIRELDPYNHPIVVHTYYDLRENFSSGPETYYDGILGSPYYDASSMQGNGSNYNRWAIEYRSRSRDAGHSWVIYGDEQGPPVNKSMNNIDQLRKETLWGNLMGGGGGVEWYFGYQDDFGDLQSEDWRVAQPLWEDTAHALHFFQTYLPFWEMEPNNDLVSHNDAFALTKTDAIYALYSPSGSPGQIDLGTTDKTFNVWWYDPRNGGELQAGTIDEIVEPGWQAVGEPPSANNLDWVVLVQATDVTIPDPDDMTVIRITENELHNAMQDNIVSNPLITDLAFVLPDFTPGTINLTVRLNDGAVATVTVSVNNTGGIAILQLSAPTINGQIAPTPTVQSINRELPLLITSALDHWIARAGAGDTKFETIAINEQFIVIETLR